MYGYNTAEILRPAPGMGASTPQSRRRNYDMRSWATCTAAAEYCGQPARAPSLKKIVNSFDKNKKQYNYLNLPTSL